MCLIVREPLSLLAFSPESQEIAILANETATFEISLNQIANVTWSVNGSPTLSEETSISMYSNSSLIPGNWNVSVRAENKNGNVTLWWLMRVREADRAPPALMFTEPTPENGSLINTSRVTFNLTANEELSKAILELDGVPYTMQGSGRNWWVTLELPDGLHTFRATGEDVHGNTNSTTEASFEIDTAPPEISVEAPEVVERGEETRATVVITDSHPDFYRIILNGEVIAEGQYSSGEGIQLEPNTSSSGNLTYTVEARDGAGNGASLGFTIRVVDTTPPEVWFIPPTPENGSILGRSRLTFNLTANENLSAAVLEIDGSNHTMEGSGTAWVLTLQVPDGEHVFRAYGTDESGNVGHSETRVIETDTTPPIVHDQFVNLTLEWERDGIYSTHAERGVRAGLLINVTEPHPGHYDVYFNPDANDPNNGWVMLYSGNYTDGVPFFVPFNTSEPAYVMYYITIYDALEHGAYGKYFFLRVRDTTPPAKIEVLVVTTFVGGAEVAWINPSDDDFNHTELWLDGSLIGNFSAAPGLWDGTTLTLTPGETYNISVVPVDRYGNRGDATWKVVTIPYPSLNAGYVPPTPPDGTELPPDTDEIKIRIESEDSFASCALSWDGQYYNLQVKTAWRNYVDDRGHIHTKLIYYCEKTFSGHLNGEHSFFAVVGDGYGHFRSLPTRHLTVLWPCFENCRLELNSVEMNYMTLRIPINFTLDTNAMPSGYSYSLSNLGLEETFEPNVTSRWVGERLLVTGSYVLDLREILPNLGKKDPESLERILSGEEPLELQITARGPCGNEVSGGAAFTVCRGNERPSLKVKLDGEYRPGESVVPVVEATDPNGNLEGVYISINGAEYMEYTAGMDISSYLVPYSTNVVRIKAVDLCGASTVVTVKVRITGPPVNGSWVVDGPQNCVNKEYTVNGSLLITSSGSLEMRNCRIHVLGRKVEVNGTLRVLEGSLIEGGRLEGYGGSVSIEDSALKSTGGGTLADGTFTAIDSFLAGEFSFDMTPIEIEESTVEGGVSGNWEVTVRNAMFTSGSGLTLVNPSSVTVENVSFIDCDYGLRLLDGLPLEMTFRNIKIDSPRGAGIKVDVFPAFGEVEFVNVTIEGGGVELSGVTVRFENSRISSEGSAFTLDMAGKALTLVNSSVSGDEAFRASHLQTLELRNTNVTGSISGEIANLEIDVEKGAEAFMKSGEARNADLLVEGIMTLRSYTLDGGLALVLGNGTFKMEDLDGVPATSDLDEDASVLRNIRVEFPEEGHLSLLNSRLENVTLVSNSKWVFIRGSVVNGYLSLSSNEDSMEQEISTENPIMQESSWYYSKSTPSADWYRSTSTDGMSEGNGPFVTDWSYDPLGWSGVYSEIREFSELYLKRTINVEEMPLRALFYYSAVGRVEVYVNGRKVVSEEDYTPDYRVNFWTGLHGVPHTNVVDIAAYLVPGRNLIAVKVTLPDEYPYTSIGAFKATLQTESGVAGITDSIIRGEVKGYGTRAIFARDDVNADIEFGYLSWVSISDSKVHGGIKVLGRLSVENSELEGNGSGNGIDTGRDWSHVSVRDSTIRNFERGIKAIGELTVNGSEISGNRIGISTRGSVVHIESSYITDNDIGIELSNVTGEIRNNVIYSNGIGIHQWMGSDDEYGYDRGNHLTIWHNTIVSNDLGARFDGKPYSIGGVGFYYNLVQNNELGLYINDTTGLGIRNDSLINEKDVYITSETRLTPSLMGIDWGGHLPVRVLNYSAGVMYTESGDVEENYDVLDMSWRALVAREGTTEEDWGSNLLSAFLDIEPMEGNTVQGVITLRGRASSRNGLSRVEYWVVHDGNVTTVLNATVNGSLYDDYVVLDTAGMNLTGKGLLAFRATDSRGRTLSCLRGVYFDNGRLVITNVTVRNATNIYTLYRVIYETLEDGTEYPAEWLPYTDRFANITVGLENIGSLNGTARIEIDLPEFIESHTGKVDQWIALPPNTSGVFYAAIPIVDYDWTTLTWTATPDELPQYDRFQATVRLYDLDNNLLDEREITVGFTLGPVFEITSYNMYAYSRAYCESYPDYCHQEPPYDGDGDDVVEAAESHHFDFGYKNVGDVKAIVKIIDVDDNILEKSRETGRMMSKSAYLFPGSSALKDAGSSGTNLFGEVGIDETRLAMDLYMDWWTDLPPVFIPPVNYSGPYITNALFYYGIGDNNDTVYYSPSLNYKKRSVRALNKTFVPQTVFLNPLEIKVVAVKDGKTYLTLRNTHDEVYYDYYAYGYFGAMEGWKWYNLLPPGFTMRAVAEDSLEPNKVIPHYRVIVGTKPSLIGNEFKVIATAIEGILGILGVDVPVELIAVTSGKVLLKMVNLADTVDFQSESETFSDLAKGSQKNETDEALVSSNETVIAVVDTDTFARLEENYGMDRSYYQKVKHLDELDFDEQMDVLAKFGKAVVMDDDMQTLFLDTLFEVLFSFDQLETYKTTYDVIKASYQVGAGVAHGNAGESAGGAASLFAMGSKKAAKTLAKELVLSELKKSKSFRSLKPADQKKMLKKTKKGVASLVATTLEISEFVATVVLAPQGGSKVIYVLDPPGNYTVRAEESEGMLVFGGSGGEGLGRGNVSLTFGERDVYRASYVALTQSLPLGRLFNGTLEEMAVRLDGRRNGNMTGNLTMVIKPAPEKAKYVIAAFRDEEVAKGFAGSYLSGISSLSVSMEGNLILLRAKGTVNAQPEDEEIHLNVTVNRDTLRASIVRIGYYRNVEIRSSFGVPLNETTVEVRGENVTVGSGQESVVISRTEERPNITISSEKVIEGEKLFIHTSTPCSLSWRLGNVSGSGNFVATAGVEPGNYSLLVECTYGGGKAEERFPVRVVSRPLVRNATDGALVSLKEGLQGFFEFGTDLYFLSFKALSDLGGVLGVYQRSGSVEAPEGYRYVTYALFNVTHPANWSVENVTIKFRVSKEWLRENNVSREEVLLIHRENGWVEYRPNLEREDRRYVYYRAKVPSLSLFAVAGKVKVETQEEPTQTETETPTQSGSQESPSQTTPAPERGNAPYYLLAALAILALVGIYLYRRG
ncbi:PGF-pre-PGF domain-containing protein [Thermococcus indicus]|uniref:PGF-pre-PGF domain-containing protein n=1 Tax=Thermococcus indicus TaxID=2586643 RepID=A0A4Y5SNF0_9EURY|nr:PGF-pre-PGF domain-containing protein [Thermococcus indicus]QDA31729.1 PGF-pre-PGF domain-containing protein [Thermococcus indicus]